MQIINFVKSKCLHLIFILSFILLVIPGAFSQMQPITMGKSVVIDSKILGQERELLIYKPDYNPAIGKKIPVVFVLDGGAHFMHVSGTVSYLSSAGVIPPMMVVAVKNINRNVDFTPVPMKGTPGSGGATKFQDFFQKEVIPFLEEKFYVSDYRVLVGHSLGGTFATFSLLNRPDLFDSYISVSPYLQYADDYLVDQTKKFLKEQYPSEKALFMTLGDEPAYYKTHDAFQSIMKSKSPENLSFKYLKMEGENHTTTPLLSVYRGLQFIFKDWIMDDSIESLKELDAQNKKLAQKYGMNVQTDEQTINLLGYRFLREGKNKKAILTFTENVRRFPESANVYDSLGDAYKAVDNIDEAKKNYEMAVKIGTEQNHPFLNAYKKNLQAISGN